MAEEAKTSGAAQNKLGELFVDIGSSGLGTLVKGLNSLSATFLLTKNAANQFIKPIAEISKNSGEFALGLGKMHSAMGMSYKDLQRLKMFFEGSNLNEGLINDISALQTKFYDISHGFRGIDEGLARSFNLMGLDITNYNGDLATTLSLIDDIREKTKNLNALDRAARLREIGLDPEWAYAFDRGAFHLSDSLLISDKDIEEKLKAEEAKAQAKVAKDQTLNKLDTKIIAPIEKNVYKGIDAVLSGNLTTAEKIGAGMAGAGSVGAGAALGLTIGGIPGAIIGGTVGALGLGSAAHQLGKKKNAVDNVSDWSLLPPSVSAINGIGYAEPNINDLQSAKPNVSISHTNYIQSTDPKEVPIEIMRNEELDIQNIQFQMENQGSN